MIKALVMFSGGLDSLLAIKILENQGIDCTALTFTTPFFGKEKAKRQAEKFGIKFMAIDISNEHFEVLKNPKYGYGKNLNPCIDCHGFMFRMAGEIADKEGYDIIASGEVLGQRPMSQNRQALVNVRKLTGRDILRPMSAKLLEETVYEKEGLVDRDQLLEIEGRGRQAQIKLAEKFGLKDYEAPGGGCLLTEGGYTDKLKLLLEKFPKDIFPLDAELIKYGRLKLFDRGFGVMGRNIDDNSKLFSLTKLKDNYSLIELKDIKGPTIALKSINGKKYEKSDIKSWFLEKVSKLKGLEDVQIISKKVE
ncbi:MAG TPA: hypothetical protein VJ892_03755 [Candidatus Absconditabacterales bacterium]|nr:hypothetical protein [Candidatus Absconditabacterales bacterium]